MLVPASMADNLGRKSAASQITNGGVRVRKAIATSLYNRAMPLIRYDLGDHIEVFPDKRDKRKRDKRDCPEWH